MLDDGEKKVLLGKKDEKASQRGKLMREQSWDVAGGSKSGRCSAAVRGKAKEKVQLRGVPECIIPFHREVRHSSRWEEGVSSGGFAAGQCYATLVRLLELVEADPPESWRQVWGRGGLVFGEHTVLLGAD